MPERVNIPLNETQYLDIVDSVRDTVERLQDTRYSTELPEKDERYFEEQVAAYCSLEEYLERYRESFAPPG